MIIIRYMYSLNSSGSAWRAILVETLIDQGYKPSITDMVVWMKPETNRQNYKEYYTDVLLYVDYLLYIYYDPKLFMK